MKMVIIILIIIMIKITIIWIIIANIYIPLCEIEYSCKTLYIIELLSKKPQGNFNSLQESYKR